MVCPPYYAFDGMRGTFMPVPPRRPGPVGPDCTAFQTLVRRVLLPDSTASEHARRSAAVLRRTSPISEVRRARDAARRVDRLLEAYVPISSAASAMIYGELERKNSRPGGRGRYVDQPGLRPWHLFGRQSGGAAERILMSCQPAR